MNLKEYAKSIECGLYSKRNTMDEALDYAYKIAQANEHPHAVITALWVVLNTVAQDLRQLDTEDTITV